MDSSTSPSASPNVAYIVPCALSPRRRVSLSSSPPSSPLPSTPPMPTTAAAFEPECITTDASPLPQWGVPRLVRFDNECVVIPESEWFAHADYSSPDGSAHTSKSGLKAVFGLNKMKKVVMVNKSYSLPLWSAGASSSQDEQATTGESGTEDEAPSHHRKVVRLNFKVPIPTFSPERPANASRHPHLRSRSVEYPRGRKNSRGTSPPPAAATAAPISPILIHRNLSPDASRSPTRGTFAPGSPPEHHPHNALYTNPRLDPATAQPFFPPTSSSPPAVMHMHQASGSSSGSGSSGSPQPPYSTPANPANDPSIFSVLPELVPLRPCCPNCSHTLEEALKQGEDWKEKFTKGARRRRRRSSSAASASSVASSVVSVDEAVVGTTLPSTGAAPPTMVLHPALDAVPVVTTTKRPSLTVTTAPAIPTTCVEETDEELEMEMETETEPESAAEEEGSSGALPVPSGKLTMAVVDEVECLKRRSASGSSLCRLANADASVSSVPLPQAVAATGSTSSVDSTGSVSSARSKPIMISASKPPASPRAFLDVPQERRRGFREHHERVASGGSMSSISSDGSGSGSGSGNESGSGSDRSRGSAGSSGSRRPAKSILKNPLTGSPAGSPLPSPVSQTPPKSKRHSYHGTPRTAREKEMERRREREESEVVMVNTLMNMNIGGSSSSSRGRVRRSTPPRSHNGSSQSLQIQNSPSGSGTPGRMGERRGTTIDLGGRKKRLCDDDDEGDYFGKAAACRAVEGDEDEDGLFPLPRSPRASPNGSPESGTPAVCNTPRANNSTNATPRGSNTPEQLLTPRGGSPSQQRLSPRASPYASPRISPRASPRASPRGSPAVKPSPLSVVSPVMGGVQAEQGDEEVLGGSVGISRHVRTVSEPFPRGSLSEERASASTSSTTTTAAPSIVNASSSSSSRAGKDKLEPFPSTVRAASGPSSTTTTSSPRPKPLRASSSGSTAASPSASHSGKGARKTAGSFSFGRNLRALGADMVKGLGSMSGMGGGGYS